MYTPAAPTPTALQVYVHPTVYSFPPPSTCVHTPRGEATRFLRLTARCKELFQATLCEATQNSQKKEEPHNKHSSREEVSSTLKPSRGMQVYLLGPLQSFPHLRTYLPTEKAEQQRPQGERAKIRRTRLSLYPLSLSLSRGRKFAILSPTTKQKAHVTIHGTYKGKHIQLTQAPDNTQTSLSIERPVLLAPSFRLSSQTPTDASGL